MFEGCGELDPADLDAAGALAAAAERRRVADAAEADLLVLAAHWADLHAVLEEADAAGLEIRMARLVPLAGPGAPLVGEFAPAELAAVLGMSTYAGGCLVGDALELRHRLPRLWARVRAGRVPVWRARRVAEHTRILPVEAAAWVDGQVAGVAGKVGTKRLTDLVAAAMWTFDPEAAAELAARRRAQRQRVRVYADGPDGTSHVDIDADPLDVAEFDATLTAIADALAALGDTDPVDARRARAVGVIADPDAVLDLLTAGPGVGAREDSGNDTGADQGTGDGIGDENTAGSEGTGSPTERFARSRRRRGFAGRSGRPVLYVHLSAETVAVDAYETPTTGREIVLLRTPCCPFPWCNNLGRAKDVDHVTAYLPPDRGGPPGQTGTHNLAGACRRHHRLKTHGGWTYTMPEPGIYLWRSPHGHRYLVDHTGTTPLAPTA